MIEKVDYFPVRGDREVFDLLHFDLYFGRKLAFTQKNVKRSYSKRVWNLNYYTLFAWWGREGKSITRPTLSLRS